MKSKYFVGAQIVMIGVLSVAAVKFTMSSIEYREKVNRIKAELDASVETMDKYYANLNESVNIVQSHAGLISNLTDPSVIYSSIVNLKGVEILKCSVNYVNYETENVLEVMKDFNASSANLLPAACNQLVFSIKYDNLTDLFTSIDDSKLNYDSIEINNKELSAVIAISFSDEITAYLGGE